MDSKKEPSKEKLEETPTNFLKESEETKKRDSVEKQAFTDFSDLTTLKFSEEITNPFSQKIEQRYTLIKELGEGGMGVVQLVRDEFLGREVALKKIHFENQLLHQREKYLFWRLQREAEFMAILEHPNIVPLYEVQVKEEGELQFTMKKVEGRTFRQLLQEAQEDHSKESQFLEILLKVCDGIRFAHAKGVIHRDLKPENIMVGNYGEVYILDWGIAKKIEGIENDTNAMNSLKNIYDHNYKTIGGIGTLGYVSPEQQKSATAANERSDIYSLGKILRECYIRLSPLQEFKLVYQSLQNVLENDIHRGTSKIQEREHQIPKEISSIIKKATAKIPEERYNDIESFATDIRNYLKDIPISAREYRFDELFRKWVKRNKKGFAFLGALLLFGIFVWGAWKWQNEQNYEQAKKEAEEKVIQAELLKLPEGRDQREQKIKLFLKSLTSINNALRYKPEKYESETFKLHLIEKLLPLCYEQEDYQLASFLVDDLQSLVHFEAMKDLLSKQVEERKFELLKQHIKELKAWEIKYKTTEDEKQLKIGERDEFVFEISKMKEEEILKELFAYLNEGKERFISSQKMNLQEIFFYQDIAKSLGRLGNKKASTVLKTALFEMWQQIEVLKIQKNLDTTLTTLKAGKLPQEIQNEFHKILKQQEEDPEKQYYLRKALIHKWEYINEQEEVFFTITFSPMLQALIIYNTQKKNNLEYLQLLNELMISLCYLQDQSSINLMIRIQSDPELSEFFSSQIKHLFRKSFQNFLFPSSPQSASEYVEQAFVYSYLGNVEKSIEMYTQAIHLNPQYPYAYYNRASLRINKNDFENALTDLNESIRLIPDFANAYLSRGLIKEKNNNFEEALLDYSEAIRLNPQFASAYQYRGNVKRKQNDLDGAISDLTEAIRLSPQNSENYYHRGSYFFEKNDLAATLADFEEAIRLNPLNTKAYHGRGVVYSLKGDLANALLDFNKAIRLDSKNANFYNDRGNVKRNKKDFAGALLDYNESIRLNPQFARAYNNRGILKEEEKMFDEAILDYSEAIRLDPQYAEAYYNRGESKRKKNNFDEAILDYNEAIRLNPQMVSAYHNRGTIKSYKKDFDGAHLDFNEVIRLDPHFILAYIARGYIKREKKDFEGAILDFTEAIRLDPKSAGAYHQRADVKIAINDLDGSILDYTEAVRLNPQLWEAYKHCAEAKMLKKDFEGAILDLDEAIRLNPQYTNAYITRGVAKSKKNDFEGSILDLSEAIRLDPQNSEAYNNRGNARTEKKDIKGAISDYTEAIRLDPQDANAYYNRGLTKYRSNNLTGAISDYTETIRLRPQDANAYYSRGLAKYNTNQVESAILDYEEAIRLQPEMARAYQARGFAKYYQKDLKSAFLDFSEAIRLAPEDPFAYYYRGLIKANQKDFSSAILDYNEALRLNPRDPLIFYNRGLARKMQQDFKGTIEDWEIGLSLKVDPKIQQLLIELLRQESRKQFQKKEWQDAKTNLLRLKKYLPLEDPQQKQLDQKIQQLEELFSSSHEAKGQK